MPPWPLPLAESSSRKSLDQLTATTAAWTGDENPIILRSKSSLLVASWDTYGWILFHAGKLAEAEDYIRAAWLNGLHAEVGEHLGDVQSARKQPQAALETYKLVLAAHPDEARRLRLQTKMEAAQAAGAKSGKPAQDQDLIDLRTLNIGGSAPKGFGEYTFLISHTPDGADKIETVKPVDDHPVPGGQALIQAEHPDHLIPAASGAHLARIGILTCNGKKCSLIFKP